jgi:hypothetical protein
MNIYKAVFDTKEQGTTYLLSIGVLIEQEEIVFAPTTAAVVYIGKVIDKDRTTDPENPVFFDGYAIDVMSSVDGLDFGSYAVYPADKSAHSFYGYPKDAEVPPTN